MLERDERLLLEVEDAIEKQIKWYLEWSALAREIREAYAAAEASQLELTKDAKLAIPGPLLDQWKQRQTH